MYVQIRTTDVLIFASSAPTPEDHWTFWLNAPVEWALGPDLQARALHVAQRIYDDMNKQMESNSSYDGRAINCAASSRVLAPQEELQKPWLTRGKSIYVLQADGSVTAAI